MTAPSTSSTNDVNTTMLAYEVSTASLDVNNASPQVSTASFSDNVVYAFMVENPNGSNLLHQDLEQIHEDDLEAMDLKWQLSLLSMRAKRYYQRIGKKIFINANDTAGYHKSKGLGYSVVPPPHPLIYNRPIKLDLSYSSLDEFKEPEFTGYGPKDDKIESNIVCDKKLDENFNDSLEKEQVSENTSSFVKSPLNVNKETIFHAAKKVEFVKPKNNEKPVKKSVSFDHVQINCPHHQRKKVVLGNNYNWVDYDYYAKTSYPSTHKNMTPRAVLLKYGLTPLSTARHVYTAHPKLTVHSARTMSKFSNQAQSTV
ncbi:hypothetical protein Tco_0407913 [Tanacetum coccineum]